MVDDGTNLVWVVDDSDACRRLVVLLAQRAGGAVREFASAEAAIHAAAIQQWPHVILTDLNMCGKSGIELITHLRAAGFSGPIALLTASTDQPTRAAAHAAGASAVLSKVDMTVAIPWFVEIALRATRARDSATFAPSTIAP